jgi:hypothetical protein
MKIFIKLFFIFVVSICAKVSYAQITTRPRLQYNYVLYTADTALNFRMLMLPLGARVHYHPQPTSVAKQELRHILDSSENKTRFWYRNNTLMHTCQAIIKYNNKTIASKTFWPNAEIIEIDKAILKGKKCSLEIWNGEIMLVSCFCYE